MTDPHDPSQDDSQPERDAQAEPVPAAPAEPAKLRKPAPRWARILTQILVGLVCLWLVTLVFAYIYRDSLRAHWWAWRLPSAQNAQQRDDLVRYLSAMEGKAIGPAVGLTRHDDATVRAAGAQVLLNILQQQYWQQGQQVTEQLRQGVPLDQIKVDFQPDPRIVERFRQLLNDPSPAVQKLAIQGVSLLGDPQAGEALAELAIRTDDADVAVAATAAIHDVQPRELPALLRKVRAQAKNANARMQAIDNLVSMPSRGNLLAIVEALTDDAAVSRLPRSQQIDPELYAALQRAQIEQGLGVNLPPLTQPTTQKADTVAGFAAQTLRNISGRDYGFRVDAPPADRERAIEQWRAYVMQLTQPPAPSLPAPRTQPDLQPTTQP